MRRTPAGSACWPAAALGWISAACCSCRRRPYARLRNPPFFPTAKANIQPAVQLFQDRGFLPCRDSKLLCVVVARCHRLPGSCHEQRRMNPTFLATAVATPIPVRELGICLPNFHSLAFHERDRVRVSRGVCSCDDYRFHPTRPDVQRLSSAAAGGERSDEDDAGWSDWFGVTMPSVYDALHTAEAHHPYATASRDRWT